nr:MAG TPA: hypothetical protein [Caudoviricetes sp.]
MKLTLAQWNQLAALAQTDYINKESAYKQKRDEYGEWCPEELVKAEWSEMIKAKNLFEALTTQELQ